MRETEGLGLIVIRKILESNQPTFLDLRESALLPEERTVLQDIRQYIADEHECPTVEWLEEEYGEVPSTNRTLRSLYKELANRAAVNAFQDTGPQIQRLLSQIGRSRREDLVAELGPLYRSLSDSLVVTRDSGLYVTAEEGMRRQEQRMYERRYLGTEFAVTMGYSELDDHYIGHKNGDLNLLVAATNMGKTYFLLKNAMTAFIKNPDDGVLFVSPEMPEDQIYNRMIFLISGINVHTIDRGEVSMQDQERLEQAQLLIKGWRARFAVEGDTKLREVRARIQDERPGFVCLDGLYHMDPMEPIGRADMYMKAAQVVREARGIALEENVPIFATTQFNRGAGKGGRFGSLSNIGYSADFERYPSNVFGFMEGDSRVSQIDPRFRTLVCLKSRDFSKLDMVMNFQFKPIDFRAVEAFPHVEVQREGRGRQSTQAPRPRGLNMNTDGSWTNADLDDDE